MSSPPEAPPTAQQLPAAASEEPSATVTANSVALEYVPAPSIASKHDPPASDAAPVPPVADPLAAPAALEKSEDVEMTPAPTEESQGTPAPKENAPPGTAAESQPVSKEEKMDVEMTTEPTEKSAETPAENTPQAPADTLAEKPADTRVEIPADEPVEKPSELPVDTSAEKPTEASAEEPDEKPSENTDEKAPVPEAEKPSETLSEQPAADDGAIEVPLPATPPRKRSRRASAKSAAASPTRTLRPRSSARSAPTEADAAQPDVQEGEGNYLLIPKETSEAKSEPVAPKSEPDMASDDAKDNDSDDGETPRPIQTDKGLRMTIGDSVFVTFDQLESVKQQRMQGKNLKPIEELTFQDILTYNRDQLRCYCYIYSTPRKKKSEMEVDMARFVSLWNEERPGFVFSEYVPKNTSRMSLESSPITARSTSVDREKADGSTRTSRRSSTPSSKAASASTTPAKQDHVPTGDQQSPMGQSSTAALANSTPGKTPAKPPGKATPKSSTKTPSRTPVRTPTSTAPTASAKRPPPRPTNIQPSPIRPNLPPRPPSSERPVAPGRSSAAVLLPNHTPFPTQASGSGSGRNSSGSSSKSARPIMPVQSMPQGFGTSHKQKVHARTAGAKFKAAYNGAGPALVNIVENAAAYFEGKDSPEVIVDRTKSYERYQFNVDLLTEIFDGPPPETEEQEKYGDVTMADADASDPKAAVTQELAKRMRSRANGEFGYEMKAWEESYKKLEKFSKESDRANMRLFQRLERAETEEDIDAVKRDFEEENNIRLPSAPPPLVRRKLDKSLAPVIMPDDKCHILRFKVA